MDLSNSMNLIKMPELGEAPNLKWLDLEGCINLFQTNQLLEKPKDAGHLERLEMNESTIQRQTTLSLYKVLTLPFEFMYSRRREDSIGLLLPDLPHFSCLRRLDLSFCNLRQVPDAIGWLHSLEELNLGGNNFISLPPSIKELSKLRVLNLEHCKQLRYFPELPSRTQGWVGRLYAGLYIFNCPKLRVIEHCYNVVFSWMIQILKVHMRSPFCKGRIEVVIPGAQIPRWFNKQNVGDSISLDPSPTICNQNWIGIACCVEFVTRDGRTNLADERYPLLCWFHVKGKGVNSTTVPIHIKKELITVESDHLWLLFLTREDFSDAFICLPNGTSNLDGVELSVEVRHPQVEVRKCGYRWVFEEDLEQLNLQMMYSGNTSTRRHKFITDD